MKKTVLVAMLAAAFALSACKQREEAVVVDIDQDDDAVYNVLEGEAYDPDIEIAVPYEPVVDADEADADEEADAAEG